MANEYREILFCFIFDEKSKPTVARELDSLKFSAEQIWTVGRLAPKDDSHRATHICLHSPFVSSTHAQLRYNPDTTFWEIRHISQKNHTFLDGARLPLNQWVEIHEDSKAVFATALNFIVFSYVANDTLTPSVDEEPTSSVTKIPDKKDLVPHPNVVTSGKDTPWQLQLITYTFGAAGTLPISRFVLLLICGLIGLAIILLLGAAVS